MTFFASYAVHMESVNIRQENCSHGKQDYISSIDIVGPCKPCLITIFMIHENLDLLAAIGRPDRARNYSFCLSLCKFGHYILDQSFHCKSSEIAKVAPGHGISGHGQCRVVPCACFFKFITL